MIIEKSSHEKKIMKKAVKRDGGVCQLCNETNTNLIIHRIRQYEGYDYFRNDYNNFVTLCRNCYHLKVKGNEYDYESMFINIIIKDILERLEI